VIQVKCFQQRAAFLLAPCCIGKLRLGEGREITLPEGAAANRISATPTAAVAAAAAAVDSAAGDAAPCCASAARADLSSTGDLTMLHYPRSSVYSSLLLRDEYLLLASKADYSDERWNFASAASSAGSRYKSFIEWDRSVWASAIRCRSVWSCCGVWTVACGCSFRVCVARACFVCGPLPIFGFSVLASEERGYVSLLSKMSPPTCTPKNDLVLGIHHSRMRRRTDGSGRGGEQVVSATMEPPDASAPVAPVAS